MKDYKRRLKKLLAVAGWGHALCRQNLLAKRALWWPKLNFKGKLSFHERARGLRGHGSRGRGGSLSLVSDGDVPF